MKHVASSEFQQVGGEFAEVDLAPPRLDSLSREIAIAAAGIPDPRHRLLAAMQLLGNLRDFLVAGISKDAEQALDEAIYALMRRERELPASWTR